MTTVLVTGGTGSLGREIRKQLIHTPYITRIMSRREAHPGEADDVQWAVADLVDAPAITDAVQGVDVIVHAASAPLSGKADVEGTRYLLDAAKSAGVEHIIYVSIIGVDQMQGFVYYKAKYDVEQMIKAGDVPYTIIRAAQFHGFVDYVLSTFLKVGLVPKGSKFQPMAPEDAAREYVKAVKVGPAGHLPDIAGPEVFDSETLVDTLLAARGKSQLALRVPFPFEPFKGFRAAKNTSENVTGSVTWANYLARTYGEQKSTTRKAAAS